MSNTFDQVRLAGLLFILLSVLFLPWWCAVLGMVLLAARSRAWEILFVGFFMDCLWLPTGNLIHPLPIFTLSAFLIVWLLEPLRRLLL